MGLEAVDTVFRLEKAFGVKLDLGFWDRLPQDVRVEPTRWWRLDGVATTDSQGRRRYERHVPLATAGDLHVAVRAVLSDKGIAVPADSWARVQRVLSEVTGHDEDEITPESRLFDDLGFG